MEGRRRSSYGAGMGDREKKIWKGLGKKIEQLFDSLIWTVMGYGVEIWGWKKRVELEMLEEMYLRWTLGVEGRTP